MKVWLLHHVHEFDDGHEDAKFIGAFSSEERAASVQNQLLNQPGFRTCPEGWSISECEVDSAHIGWPEGYVTSETVYVPATLDGAELLLPLQAWREEDEIFTIQTGHALPKGITLKFHEGSKVRCRQHKINQEVAVCLAYESSSA